MTVVTVYPGLLLRRTRLRRLFILTYPALIDYIAIAMVGVTVVPLFMFQLPAFLIYLVVPFPIVPNDTAFYLVCGCGCLLLLLPR